MPQPGERGHGTKWQRQEKRPTAEQDANVGDEVAERNGLGAGQVVRPPDGGLAEQGIRGGRTQVVDVHRLNERPPSAGQRHHGTAGHEPDETGEVPVSGIAVDHRRAQDREASPHRPDAVLGRPADGPRGGRQPCEESGGREVDRSWDAGRLHGAHDPVGVSEAERGHVHEGVGPIEQPGERPCVGHVALHRRHLRGQVPSGRGGANKQSDHKTPAEQFADDAPPGEPGTAGHGDPHGSCLPKAGDGDTTAHPWPPSAAVRPRLAMKGV